jgi:hypothetical protein
VYVGVLMLREHQVRESQVVSFGPSAVEDQVFSGPAVMSAQNVPPILRCTAYHRLSTGLSLFVDWIYFPHRRYQQRVVY